MPSSTTTIDQLTGIYNLRDFLSLPLERPTPALAGLLFEGQTGILAGRFGVGKTLFSTQMALCLASGKDFLGRAVHRPYKVAFVDCENGPNEIHSRVQHQLKGLLLSEEQQTLVQENWYYANARDIDASLFGFLLDKWDKDYPQLARFLNECETEIAVIDCLAHVMSGKEEDTEDVKRLFLAIKRLKQECPLLKVLLLLHHIKKLSDHSEKCSLLHSPYEFLNQIRGSGRLLDLSEMRYALAEEELGNDNYLVFNGIARSAETIPMVMERAADGVSLKLVEDKRVVMSSVFAKKPKLRALVELIARKYRGVRFRFKDAAELVDADGKVFNRGTVDSALKVSVSNELFVKHEDGSYSISETLY